MVTESLLSDLRAVVGDDGVIADPVRLLVYESDGLTAYRRAPAAVVLPRSTSEVQDVLRLLHSAGVPFVPRGAGTGLSGGCLAGPGTVVVGTSRMNRILDVDPLNRTAVVQPGVINAHLTQATRPHGLYYAPDPSSQSTCTLGGNVAENSGGPHCLKYGVTSRYITALTVVLPSGEVVRLSGFGQAPGLDLLGLFIGSEGNFGIATEIETRLLPLPESVRTLLAIFDRVEDAGRAVTSIIAEGLLPAALEIIDGPTIRAVEASIFAAGYPVDAGAALVVEFDGLEAGLDHEADLARRASEAAGARDVRVAETEEDRLALWRGRKKAFGAMGRIAPDLLVQDATVPRTRLPDVLGRIEEIGSRYDLKVANVFHAGDGNLHPNILFDRRDEAEVERVEAASQEIMQACVDAGGTITGEHGVGVDKRGYMTLIHDDAMLDAFAAVKLVFDPEGRSNPGKVLPDEVWARARVPEARGRGTSRGSRIEFEAVRAALPATVSVEPGSGEWEIAGRTPVAVVFPGDTGEAAAVMAAATAEGWSVAPAGAGTWLTAWCGHGTRPGAVDVVVSTREMREVAVYEPADLTLTADAGLSVRALADATALNGQWLAVDAPGTGTLGGLAATGSAGPLQAGFSGLRDHVLGLTLVTGDGRVLELGGRVVKNVAGFDLLKLVVGSWGIFGLITRVTVRLHPLPQSDTSLVWRGESAASLAPMARRLATSTLVPHSLELVRSTGVDGIGAATLTLRTMGTAAAVERSVELFRAAAGRAPDEVHGTEVRGTEEGAGPETGLVRIWRRPADLDELTALADEALDRSPEIRATRAAIHVTEGLLRLSLEESPDPDDPAGWVGVGESDDRVRIVVGATGDAGTTSGGDALPAASAASDEPTEPIVRGLRTAFDPAGVLWPAEAP